MNRTPSTKKGKKRETDRQTTECNQHVDKFVYCVIYKTETVDIKGHQR